MSCWHDDDKTIAVQPMVICFSREKQVSVVPKDVYRPSIFFLPHHYPFALLVYKSPVVYILSSVLDGLWRENRGSVNRLKWKGTFWSDQNDQTSDSGPHSKLIPNISVGPNRNGLFHLLYQPKLPEFWVEWKEPLTIMHWSHNTLVFHSDFCNWWIPFKTRSTDIKTGSHNIIFWSFSLFLKFNRNCIQWILFQKVDVLKPLLGRDLLWCDSRNVSDHLS